MSDKTPVEAKGAQSDSREKYNHGILTDAEVDAAKDKARKKALAARAKKAQEQVEAQETERLMVEEGINTNEEMVTIVLDLAPDTVYLATNGKRYENGKTYTVPRSVAADLSYRAFCGQKNEAARLGQDKTAFYRQRKSPVINHVGGKVQ